MPISIARKKKILNDQLRRHTIVIGHLNWYIHHKTRKPRQPMNVTPDIGDAKFKMAQRYGFGWTDPRSIYIV
jgi:hypothetical protein